MSKISERVSNSFQGAIAAKSEHGKIQELKQQLEKLGVEAQEREQLVAQLRQELEQQSGKTMVPIDQIAPSPQCRVTFTEKTIRKRCNSLLDKGQLEPLILIVPDEEGDPYLTEDGEITWRAATLLVEEGNEKYKFLEAVFSNLAPGENIHRRTLFHHLHSETLTPLDRAEAVVKEIMVEVKEDQDEVIRLLRNIKYRLERADGGKKLLKAIEQDGTKEVKSALVESGLSEKQIQVIDFLQELQVNLISFVANDLGMILLSEDLKLATRTRGLGCHQAKHLNQLQSKKLGCSETEADNIRAEAIEKVLKDDLSKTETSKLVVKILEEQGAVKATSSTATITENYRATKDSLSSLQINQLKPRQLQTLKKVMEKKLAEISEQIANT